MIVLVTVSLFLLSPIQQHQFVTQLCSTSHCDMNERLGNRRPDVRVTSVTNAVCQCLDSGRSVCGTICRAWHQAGMANGAHFNLQYLSKFAPSLHVPWMWVGPRRYYNFTKTIITECWSVKTGKFVGSG
jgi:hypothetical protein